MSQTKINAVDAANTIRSFIAPLIQSDNELSDMKRDVSEAKASGQSSRATILLAIADASHTGAWPTSVVDDAIKLVVANKAGNSEMKLASTIVNFCSEVKLAAHPKARAHAATIFGLVDEAWEAEEAAYAADKKTAPTPIKIAFSRRYHAKLAVLRAVRGEQGKSGIRVNTVGDVVNYALATDPSLSAEKADKQLNTLHASLKTIEARFPHADLTLACEMIAKIELDDLREVAAKRAPVYKPGRADTTPSQPAHTPDSPTGSVEAMEGRGDVGHHDADGFFVPGDNAEAPSEAEHPEHVDTDTLLDGVE